MGKRRQFTPEFKAQVVLDILTGVQSQARRAASTPSAPTCWPLEGRPSWSERIPGLRQRRCAASTEDRPGSPSWSRSWAA